ncbi:acyl-CoA dehydrogenase family protein, partial [Stenotrophomonas sp.]
MHVPTMNFDLGEEIDLLRQSVAHFASAEVAPLAAKADEENLFPNALWRKFGEQGLLGLTVEEEYGG